MKDQHPAAAAPRGATQPVIVVGAGPVGAATALLLADAGIPVTLLERTSSRTRCPAPCTWTTKWPGSWTGSA